MPPREFITPRDKREELKTYRELALRRDLKSIRQRRRLEASGLQRVLGDGSSGQPYLVVASARYRQVRLAIQHRLLLEAKRGGLDLSVDLLLRQLKPRIEALVYVELAQEQRHEARRHVPVAALGRALTAEEQFHFSASHAAGEIPTEVSPTAAASGTALDRVLGQIEQRQVHNPARHQTIWAEVVGAEAAQQTYLERVDATTQIAWFRCTNATLAYALSRKPAFSKKLAKLLGVPVRQLRAKF